MELTKQGAKSFISTLVKHTFHTLSLTILSLLLPLSFLLLSRLTSSPISLLLCVDRPLLHLLVSFASIATLLHSLTGRCLNPPKSVSWAVLFLSQACITLGIEATILTETRPSGSTNGARHSMWIERVVFLVGLYETMMTWARMFVRPVVDDTIFGAVSKEGVNERAAIGVAFSALWVWMLRDEVEPLVWAGQKRGFVCWLVSYTTVMTGMLKAVEVLVLVGKYLFLPSCREVDECCEEDKM